MRHHHTHHGMHGMQDHDHGDAGGSRILFVIIVNVLITAAEYIGGVLSGSLALISDAGHNLSDVLSLVLGYAGERVSRRGPDRKFTFGLKRFEVLIALVNSLSLVFIGLYIVYDAVLRYMHPVEINPCIMLPVAVVGLAGNILSIFMLNRDRNSSLNMRAAFLHLFFDAISSVAVIAVGVVLIFYQLVFLDLAVSLIIAVMIVLSSMDIIRDSLRIVLQGAPRGLNADDVYQALLSVGDVDSVHGLHVWSINSSEVFLSCHICVNPENGAVDTDGLINSVNRLLEERFGITHTALQVENTKLCTSEGGDCCR